MSTRRSSRNIYYPAQGFDPRNISGLAFWGAARFNQFEYNDTDTVDTFYDASGLTNDFTQSTEAKKPTFVENVINGFPVIRFDGTDDFVSKAGIIEWKSLFLVYKVAATAASSDRTVNVPINDTSNANHVYHTWFEGSNIWIAVPYADAAHTYAGTDDNAFHVHSVIGGTTDNSWFDAADQSVTPGATPGASTATRMQIGCSAEGDDANPTLFLDGDLAEILLYTEELATPDRVTLEVYLNTIYGIY